jgi:hypothetical protein
MDLLTKEKGLYANTAFSLKYLVRESPDYAGFIIMHHHHLMDSWNRMGESVLSGKPCRQRSVTTSETERESFLMGMFNLAMELAPHFAQRNRPCGPDPVSRFRGGPGNLRHPFLHGKSGDDGHGVRSSHHPCLCGKTIARFSLTDRIDFKEGSYATTR